VDVTYPGATVPPDTLPIGPTLAFSSICPNPIQSSAKLWYPLPAATTVSLSVYDIQGRRVETLLNQQPQLA
jgi:hypothetical protein